MRTSLMRSTRRALLAGSAALLISMTLAGTTNDVASAVETNPNCTAIGDTGASLSAGGIGTKIPKGGFCLGMNSEDGKLSELRYSFGTFRAHPYPFARFEVCNYWVDFRVTDRDNRTVLFSQGALQTRCAADAHGSRTGDGLPIARPIGGTVCAVLWRNGASGPVKVGTACDSIT